MKNKKINYLFTIVILSITTWILFSSSEMGIIPKLLEITNIKLLAGAILCMTFYWLTDAYIVKNLYDVSGDKINFFSFFKISIIGQYYSLITPLGSGGQAAMVLKLINNYKTPTGFAASISINKFMMYHIVINVFPVLMLILKPAFLLQQNTLSKTFIISGLALNTLATLAIIGIAYNRRAVEKIVFWLLKILKKIKPTNKIQPVSVSRYIKEYNESLNTFVKNKKLLVKVSALTFFQVIIYFSVTWFVYLSLGLSEASLLDVLAVQSLLYMAVNFIPTPGNTGTSEGFFYLIFGIIFPSTLIVYAIVLWRLVIYYFSLIATGLFVLADNIFIRRRIGNEQGNPAK